MNMLRRATAVFAAVAIIGPVVNAAPAHAVGAEIVLNEVMFHAAEGTDGFVDDDYDFVELANVGDAPLDLLGWEITEGVDFVFVESTVIEPGGFVVLAQNADAFEERYGFGPTGEFDDGKLKNSSEEVEISDGLGNAVDALEYNDDPPWPGAADGNGPSLERLDVERPNVGDDTDAANWLASDADFGTPGAVNSVLTGGPRILDVDDGDERPAPDAPITISATVVNVDNVTLEYRVDFKNAKTLAMVDDESSVGGAGDGVFSVDLPAEDAGTLIRYNVSASNSDATSRSPRANDTIDNHGLVVADPDAHTDLPILDWFIRPTDYNQLLGQYRYTDVYVPAVFAYGDQVIDNAGIRVRGGATRRFRKPSFKVELPGGQEVFFEGQLDAPVDEFNIYLTIDPATEMAWDIADEVGLQSIDMFPWRVYQNGDSWGAGSYLTATDGRYRDDVGYDDAAVYKAANQMNARSTPEGVENQWEKDEGADDFTDVWELTNIVDAPPSAEQFDALMETLDVPAVINYWAWVSFVQQSDAASHNHFVIRNPEGSGRWHVDPWDMSTFDHGKDGAIWANNMTLIQTLDEYPEFREMHQRRLRSMIDQFTADELIGRYDAQYDLVSNAFEDDYAAYRQGSRPSLAQREWAKGVTRRFDLFASSIVGPKGQKLPPSQSADRPLSISSVRVGDEVDTIVVTNDSETEAFDLGGWKLEPVDIVIQQGTVLLPGTSVTFSSDDELLRASTSGLFAAGEFGGDLPGFGLVTLSDAVGAEVASVEFGADPTLDTDGDEIPDIVDNCVADANADQADGDGDGVGDVCDADLSDGPLGDVDGDGVLNPVDNCVADANADQADGDGDGLGDACDQVTESPATTVTVPGAATRPELTLTAQDGALEASWIDVDGATKYRFRYRAVRGTWSGWTQTGLDTAATIEGLTNDTEYTVAVSARVGGSWRGATKATVAPEGEPPVQIDSDGDGVPDSTDNCVDDANVDQADGDGDGVGNVCDPVFDDSDALAEGVAGVRPTVRADIDPGIIVVSWDAVDGATDYRIRWRSYRRAWNTAKVSAFEWTIQDVIDGAPYTIQVRASVDGRWQPWTEVEVVGE